MKRKKAARLLGILLSITLAVGNTAEVSAFAMESAGKETAFQVQPAVETEEITNAIIPDEIEEISQEEARELWREFEENTGLEAYSEPAINNSDASGYGYSALETAEQREFYNVMLETAFSFHSEYREPISRVSNGSTYYLWANFQVEKYNFTKEQLQQVVFAVDADHPEFFWITGNFSYSTINNVISYFYPRLEEDYVTVDARKEAQAKIDDNLPEFLDKIDAAKAQSASEMEMELLIHDMIADAIDYAYVEGTKTPESAGYAHSIVGVFAKEGAVCEGYAKSFQLLADYAGLESIYAVGYGNGGGHAWNLVCLEEAWYNLDVTWDDSGNGAANGGIRYLYYNCDTDSFGNHVYRPDVFPGMYDVPDTVTDAYNYYIYYDLYAREKDVESDESFEEFMKKAVNRCGERGDYLLQMKSENSSVQSQMIQRLGNSGQTVLNKVGNPQRAYRIVGGFSYTSSGGYVVYYPMICIYADSYRIPYNPDGAELSIHMVKGREEIVPSGNYTITYQDNEQVGTAQAYIIGAGTYENMFPATLEFSIIAAGITETPAISANPTSADMPTISVEPTNIKTPTVTVEPTSVVTPTVSGVPTITQMMEITAVPTLTAEPTNTKIPTITVEPTETPTPTITVKPAITEAPTITAVPTKIQGPTITTEPVHTMTPTPIVSLTVTPSQEPTKGIVTTVPTITVVVTSAITPAVTQNPSVSATRAPVNTKTPTVTKAPTNTAASMITRQPTVTQGITKAPEPILSVTAKPTNSVNPIITKSPTPVPTRSVIVPKQVTGVKFVSANSSMVVVSYSGQKQAAGYELSLYQDSKKVRTVNTTKTTYTFQKLNAGTAYSFTVRAYGDKSNDFSYGKSSKAVKVSTATKAPKISNLKKNGKQIVITWEKVGAATGYEVYMSQKKSGGYKKIAAISKVSTVKCKKKLKLNKRYYFKVRTYIKVGNKKVYSSYSKVKSKKM